MQRRTNTGWTAEQDTILRELAAKDRTALQIGLRLKRSASGVKKRAIELGVKLGRTKRLPYSERVDYVG
jgi:hypothetical protein